MQSDISIIIPVLFEKAGINDALECLSFHDSPYSIEIIVVDGDPGGSTNKVIHPGRLPAFTAITAPTGRGSQMNAGARIAGGRILLFLHADTRLPADALERVVTACAHPRVAGGAFDLAIASSHPLLNIIGRIASLRSRLTRIPYGDQAIFIKKSIFSVMGGYAEIPIMEDIEIMRRMRRARHPIVILPEQAVTSARRWKKDGICFTSLRNIIISTLYYLGVTPERLKRFYL